ncbi:hypothetical protein LAUMK41_05566 [Mycobacterium attenuatum]|nr:hypothetical protein LAUMK41_05566 [Mycobacterium attenuatum]
MVGIDALDGVFQVNFDFLSLEQIHELEPSIITCPIHGLLLRCVQRDFSSVARAILAQQIGGQKSSLVRSDGATKWLCGDQEHEVAASEFRQCPVRSGGRVGGIEVHCYTLVVRPLQAGHDLDCIARTCCEH